MDTNSFLSLSTQQLRRAAEIKEQIDQLTGELNALLSGGAAPAAGRRGPGRPAKAAASGGGQTGGRRQMSAAGRARIAAAARARWAKFHAQQGGAPKKNASAGKSAGRRQMSPEARARIAAAARARWAKAKAAGKSRL